MDAQKKMRENGSAVALGYFDGIHMGHRAVLERALSLAKEKDLVPAVLLFTAGHLAAGKIRSGYVDPDCLRRSGPAHHCQYGKILPEVNSEGR